MWKRERERRKAMEEWNCGRRDHSKEKVERCVGIGGCVRKMERQYIKSRVCDLALADSLEVKHRVLTLH